MATTRISTAGLAVLLAGALALAACGGDDTGDTSGDAGQSPATTGTGTTDEPDDATGQASVTVATTTIEGVGEVLVDGAGMTLYLFDNDGEDESTCVDDCAATWPPLVGEPEAAGGVDESLLGTTTRPDGSAQATYAGFPLYLYAADAEPGDVNGQGVGDVWWLVGADGSRITGEAGASSNPDY